jgi:hypothetical protein
MSNGFTGKIALVAGCALPPDIGHAIALRQGATVI